VIAQGVGRSREDVGFFLNREAGLRDIFRMKNNRTSFALMTFTISLLLLGCNSNLGSSANDGRLIPQNCPTAYVPTNHRILVHTKRKIPKIVSVVVDGVVKFDECLPEPTIPPAPLVSFQRQPDGFQITVMHFDGYAELPKETSMKVFDRNDCRSLETEFFVASKIPLKYTSDSPGGAQCGSNLSAIVELSPDKHSSDKD
jgi:hypothetical protein